MQQQTAISLEDFAASVRPLGCWVCIIPERSEIDEAINGGISLGVIRRWLLDIKGYAAKDATWDRLDAHRRRGHAEPRRV